MSKSKKQSKAMWRKKKILLEEFKKYDDIIFDDKDKFFEKLKSFDSFEDNILEIWCWNGVYFANLSKNNHGNGLKNKYKNWSWGVF